MYKIIGSGLCIMYIVGNIWSIGFLISQGYILGAFPVLSFGPSVWRVDFPFLNGFSHFRFPIFHFPIWIFCAEHHTYNAPGPRGTEGLPLPLPFPVALAVASVRSPFLSHCRITRDHGDRRPKTSGAEQMPMPRPAADSRLTAGPLQSPRPSCRLAYSSRVGQTHIVRGRAGYPEDRRRAGAWMV